MSLTPQITLTATLEDITGQPAGTTANPAKLQIVLCNYGLTLPQIPGTSSIAKRTITVLSTGSPVSVSLWGNDVLTPTLNALGQIPTYYAITVYDGEGNVVQTGCYQFVGTLDVDLSEAPQVYPIPQPPTPCGGSSGGGGTGITQLNGDVTAGPGTGLQTATVVDAHWKTEVVTPVAGVATIDCSLASVFSLELTGNVTIDVINITPGKTVMLMIEQNGTGGYTVTWPASVLTYIDPVNPAPNGKTMMVLYTWPDNTLMQTGYYP